MPSDMRLSFVYSMLMVSILVLTFLIASRFVDLSKEDFLTALSANTVVIAYLFAILLLAAVAMGFAFVFFRLDTIEEALFERLDESNALLRAAVEELQVRREPEPAPRKGRA